MNNLKLFFKDIVEGLQLSTTVCLGSYAQSFSELKRFNLLEFIICFVVGTFLIPFAIVGFISYYIFPEQDVK